MNQFPFPSAPISRPAMIALADALEARFNETDWSRFAHEVDEAHYILGHDRLLRSMRFGDPDHGAAVLQVLNYLRDHHPSALGVLAQNPKVETWLEKHRPEAAAELGLSQAHVPAPQKILSTTEVVERALKDADHLLHTSGAVSCVDRLHTALHGYLRDICAKAHLASSPDASLTSLFKLLRSEHPSFKQLGAQDNEMGRVLVSMSGTIDALNTLRNRASVAHPNELLLGEPEAMLMVNFTRSLFHYLKAKI